MGYLEGLLGGFTNRKREVETENLRLAEQRNDRESKIYSALINSPDPDVQSLAITGLLTSAQGPKKRGGLAGWLGELETNPALGKIQSLVGTQVPVPLADQAPSAVGTPSGGQVSAVPASSLAQPPTAATQGGPMASIEPAASQLPGTNAGGAVGFRPRQFFLSPEEQMLRTKRASAQGDVEGEIAGLVAAGVAPDKAREAVLLKYQRRYAGGAMTPHSVAGERADGTPAYAVFDPSTRQYLDADTQEPIPDFRPRTTTGSTNLGADRESMARELFGKPAAQLTAEQMAQVNDRLVAFSGTRAGTVTAARGEASADIPLSTQQRFQATTELSKQWTTLQAPLREMARQAQLMETGLARYDQDPIGGSQAVLVTFQKILDPTSVVRESEYARSPQGLSVMDRLEGLYERYKGGGAGVPKPVLAQMVVTAKEFLKGMQDWNEQHRQRIYNTATSYQIDPSLVLGPDAVVAPTSPPPQVGAPPPTAAAPIPRKSSAAGTPPPGAPAKGAAAGPGPEWTMVNGVLHYKGKPY